MNEDRSLFQAIWSYLTPVSQMRIRMTCKNLYVWSKGWTPNIPNLEELLNVDNWFEWSLESGRYLSAGPQLGGTLYPNHKFFRWSSGCVMLEVVFITRGEMAFLRVINLHFDMNQGPLEPNLSSFVSIHADSDASENRGLHPRRLPEGIDKKIFSQLRKTLVLWKGSKKIRRKLFPYCSHCFGRNPFPEKLTWKKAKWHSEKNRIRTIFACDKCLEFQLAVGSLFVPHW